MGFFFFQTLQEYSYVCNSFALTLDLLRSIKSLKKWKCSFDFRFCGERWATVWDVSSKQNGVCLAAHRPGYVFPDASTEEDLPDDARGPEPAPEPAPGLDVWPLADKLPCGASSLPLPLWPHVSEGGRSKFNFDVCKQSRLFILSVLLIEANLLHVHARKKKHNFGKLVLLIFALLQVKPVVSQFLKEKKLPYQEDAYLSRLRLFFHRYQELMVFAPPITELVGVQWPLVFLSRSFTALCDCLQRTQHGKWLFNWFILTCDWKSKGRIMWASLPFIINKHQHDENSQVTTWLGVLASFM